MTACKRDHVLTAGDVAEVAAATWGGGPGLPLDLEATEIATEADQGDAEAVAEATLSDWLATVLGAL